MFESPDSRDLIFFSSRLCGKKFCPGIDNVSAQRNLNDMLLNSSVIVDMIEREDYRPMPALLFAIVSKHGKERELARFTARDTVVQQAAAQRLSDGLTPFFSKFSFAYIPGRGVHMAVAMFSEYAGENQYAAIIDPRACFDSIDRGVLFNKLERLVDNTRLLSLVKAFAKADVADEKGVHSRSNGIIQGSPLSPILCNLYFNDLDHLLESKDIPFCRYGDDIVVFAKSLSKVTERAQFVADHLINDLKLDINAEKLRIGRSCEMSYLGHVFIKDTVGRIIASPKADNTPKCISEKWVLEKTGYTGKSRSILSDGILTRRDFSLVFEGESGAVSIPAGNVDQINVYSSATFAPQSIKAAFDNGININVFDRYGELLGRFIPETGYRNIKVPINQLDIYRRTRGLRAEYARDFLLSQLHNIRLNLRYQVKQYENPVCDEALDRLKAMEKEIKKCNDIEAMLLFEARMRELYYGCFSECIRNKDFSFIRRTRRPPQDEINSMLSFGNVFLYNYIAVEINKTPLDIRIAFLHATTSRAESLNLDLADVFKPLVVDRTIFSLVNNRRISKNHFYHEPNGGVYLTNEGKKLFVTGLMDKLGSQIPVGDAHKSYAEVIRDEVRTLCADIKALKKHRSFRQIR